MKLGLGQFPTDVAHSFRPTCCMSEKKVSSYKIIMVPLYDVNKVSTIESQTDVKPLDLDLFLIDVTNFLPNDL